MEKKATGLEKNGEKENVEKLLEQIEEIAQLVCMKCDVN